MKVEINKDACIGCGACQMVASDVFEINDEGLSEVINNDIDSDLFDEVQSAADACPTSAIKVEKED